MAQTIATATVTAEQLDRCTRILDLNRKEAFYMVESESDPTVEYKVSAQRHGTRYYVTCTCKAGQAGISCKHVRWCIEAARLYRLELAEQSLIEALVGQGVSRDTATRVVYAKSTIPFTHELAAESALQAQRNKGFQLMR